MSSASHPDPQQPSGFDRWLGQRHRPAHARRTAASNAAFLLPHLRPGMRLLDCGCGPGSITAGLADAVAPGAVIGLDVHAAATQEATRFASTRAGLRFCTADVTALPFPDDTFDVVFAHALLQHLPDPGAALREMSRVLKRGGLIAIADADYDGSIIAPEDPLLAKSMDLLANLRTQSGRGDARIGKQLRRLLHEAGFERVEASARAGAYGTDDSVRATGAFWSSYFESPELAAQISAAALATPDELRAMSEAWRRWSQHPAAFWATFWCEALARKPQELDVQLRSQVVFENR